MGKKQNSFLTRPQKNIPLKFQDFINSAPLIRTYLGYSLEHIRQQKIQSPCSIGPENGCGACPLSNLPYHTQLELKTAYMRYLLDFINQHSPISNNVTEPKLNVTNSDLAVTQSNSNIVNSLNNVTQHNVTDYNVTPNKVTNSLHIIPAPRPDHYRNKMEYTIGFDGSIGLRAKGKWWKVLHNHTCFLAHPKIEELFHKFIKIIPKMQLPYYDRKKHTGLLRLLTIRVTNTNDVAVRLTISDPSLPQYNSPYQLDEIKHIVTQHTKHLNIDSFYLQLSDRIADVAHGKSVLLYGKPYVTEEFQFNNKKIRFAVTPDTFFQVNTYLTKTYLQLSINWFESIIKSGDIKTPIELFDLYGGIGFFGLTMLKLYSKYIKKLIIVEENPHSIKAGIESARLMKLPLSKIIFQQAQVEEIINTVDPINNVAIIDPARVGLHPKVIQILIQKPCKHLLYISCNPKRFVEEVRNDGLSKIYKITQIAFLDNFPNTFHLEAFFFLKYRDF